MRLWLDYAKPTVAPTTFGGYQTTVEKKFIPYFKKKQLALANRHSTVSVTLNIYTHLDWSRKENAAQAMESAVKLPPNTAIENQWEK